MVAATVVVAAAAEWIALVKNLEIVVKAMDVRLAVSVAALAVEIGAPFWIVREF